MVHLSIMGLRCPHCSTELGGAEHDALYSCPGCRKAYEVELDRLVPRDIAVIKPKHEPTGKTFFAPVWMFNIEATIDSRPEDKERATKAISQYKRVYVPAFRMWRPSYYGNPGILYSSAKLEIETVERERPPFLAGIAKPIKQAVEFVKPTLMLLLDRIIDIAWIDIRGEIKNSELLAVPFVLNGEDVQDTQLNWKYSAIMFEDLDALLEGNPD